MDKVKTNFRVKKANPITNKNKINQSANKNLNIINQSNRNNNIQGNYMKNDYSNGLSLYEEENKSIIEGEKKSKQKLEKIIFTDSIFNEDQAESISDDEDIQLNNSEINKYDREMNLKIDFAHELIENKNILESVDEDALLATVKYLFEIQQNKKCVNLCLKSLKIAKFEKIKAHLHYLIALCFYANNKPKMAAKHFNISITEGIPFTSFYYIGMDILEKNLNSYESCLAYAKLMKRRKQLNPECIVSRIRLAQFYSKIKDINNAINEYEELYNLTNSKEFLLNLCLLYMIQKNLEKLGNTYLRLARNIKLSVHGIQDNLIIKTKEGKEEILAKSIQYYLEAFKLNPKNIEIILELSEIHRAIDKHKEALGFIDLAMKVDKNDYRIYYEGFLIYDEIGDMHTAKEMIKLCLILNISFIKGYNTLGNILRKEKLYEEALKVFSTALSREPENVQLLNNLGNCYLEMGKRTKAKQIYLQAYELNQSLFEVNCNLATIFKKEYDYNRAIEHILKASKMEPHNPQVLSILSSIYREAGWYNTSIKSCIKALENDPGNIVAFIQLAHSYKANKLFKEAKDCCLQVLDTQPKLNETYLIYLECILSLGEWSVVEANKKNIRVLAEFQLQKNIINTNIPAIISDFFLDELALKAWIFNKYAIQDYLESLEYLNSDKTSEENFLSEIPKSTKKQKNPQSEILNVGYIVDKIEDYYTLYYLLLMRSQDQNIRTFIIVYESTPFISSFCENDFFIVFETVQHPLFKSETLKKFDLDVIIFFENLCSEIYDNLTIRKINQLLAYKPASLVISFPYNGITRSERIYDYVILDKHIYTDENRVLFQEKLIVCDAKDFSVKPEKFWTSLKTKDFSNLFRLNKMTEEELENEIQSFNFPQVVFFGNLSEAYKITEKFFACWLNILKHSENTKLILKYSNDLQVENFKANAEKNGVDAERLIFISCRNRDEYIDALKAIDIYLDINYLNCEDKLVIALFLHICCVCFAQLNDSENVLNNFCLRFLDNSKIETFASSFEDYERIALDCFNDLTVNQLNVGYTRLKKIQLIQNLKENFNYMLNNPLDLPVPCGDFPIKEIYKYHYENKGDVDIFV